MRRRISAADVVLALSAICLAAALGYRTLAPRPQPAAAPAPAPAPAPILAAGEVLPAFWRDLGWNAPPDGPTLVIFYTAECPYCRVSVKRWNELRRAARAVPGARAVAVALSDSAASLAYPAQTGLAYPIHLPADGPAMEARWKVRAVPYTVLVEPDGRVRGAWRGAVDSLRYDVVSRSLRGAPR